MKTVKNVISIKEVVFIVTLIFCFSFFVLGIVSAHPGNTDSSGCHTCRTNCTSWGLSYGEYHCHNSKTTYSAPVYTPSIPSCPSFSSYSYTSKTCECYSGYTSDKNGTGCISMSQWCRDKYGWNSNYNSLNKTCECGYGYIFGKSFLGETQCVSGDIYCHDLYGYNSDYDTLSKTCECDYGFSLKNGKCAKDDTSYYNFGALDSLLSATTKCGLNSYATVDDKCKCNDGYIWEDANDAKNFDCIKKTCSVGYVLKNNDCITYTKDCENYFGLNVYGVSDSAGKSSCYCNSEFEWNTEKTACVVKQTTNIIVPTTAILSDNSNFLEMEKNKISKVDNVLSNKLSGKILLQVENKGQAWYVNPTDKKRYYMADGDQAYNIMRSLGVGITNDNLQNIKTNQKFAKANSGKIFLQVEDKGQAYYIDSNGGAHYLKDGDAAYDALRELGLGISNDNINKIDIK